MRIICFLMIFGVLGSLWMACPAHASDVALEPAALADHLRGFPAASFRAKCRSTSSKNGKPWVPSENLDLQIWFDAANYKEKGVRTVYIDGKKVDTSGCERIRTPQRQYGLHYLDETRISGVVATLNVDPSRQFARQHQNLPYAFGLTLWLSMENAPLSDILSQSAVSRIADERYVVYKSKGPWGTHTLWLDPKQRFALVKVIVEK